MTKSEATKEGEKLLARMEGKGWKLDVWENLGWHYRVHNGDLGIYPASDGYSALLSAGSGGGAGNPEWSVPHGRDPNKVALRQLKECKKVLQKLFNMYFDLVSNIHHVGHTFREVKKHGKKA